MSRRHIHRWPDVESIIGGAFLVLIMLTLLAQASARILGVNLPITEEFARYQLFAIGFIGLSAAIVGDAHLGIDLIPLIFGVRGQWLARVLAHLLMIVLLIILFWLGVQFFLNQVASGRLWFSAPIPQWIVYTCYPVGCLLGILRLLERLAADVRNPAEGKR
jgi:TRAP-type C4-dicarboxylate transport system permease small subunit